MTVLLQMLSRRRWPGLVPWLRCRSSAAEETVECSKLKIHMSVSGRSQ